MKTIKYIFSMCIITLLIISCVNDDDNTDFVNTAVAPTNVMALFNVTQDNTGLVTITPTAENAINFNIFYGDATEEPANIMQGENAMHTYEEGTYTVRIVAVGVTGLETEITKELAVSFNAPSNLVATAENDVAISKQVNVLATADDAVSYDVDFGDGSEILTGNIGEIISHIYADAGTYNITVVAMGAAIETTQFIIEDFEVTAILQPLASAPTPPARAAQDVISVFSAAYTDLENTNFFPDWGQGGQGSSWAMFDLAGDQMLQYINLSYQGVALEDGTSVDVSAMEFLHIDVWTADVTTQIETSLINNPAGSSEAPVTNNLNPNDWTSIDIPISDYTDQGLSVNEIFQLKFVGTPWAAGTVFIDNIYFWKESTGPSPIVGTWKIAPEEGALEVGDGAGTIWWAIPAADVATRACYFDDEYIFNADGSFQNVLGTETWLETWQGVAADGCGAPIAPHNGSSPATYIDNGNSLTISGVGAYLGIPKVHNTGEDGMPVNDTITYDYVIAPDGNTLEITISGFNGGTEYWYYKLIKDSAPVSPLIGTWKVASEEGALEVGDGAGTVWWSIPDADLAARACYFDDAYIFNADGSFQNVLGTETWLETWQGVAADGCGAPIAPHNGTNTASYTSTASTVTVNGLGAYLGLPKVHNTGENGMPDNDTITYDYVLSTDGNTLDITISGFNGGTEYWYYKLIKQ
ncbi:PKD domain-containing protein [Oceanihabitans sp. 2_MG-2023]|uniref:PKD domain-containing protein n=1 Tax=Oceanihabitans sp. 2_MG-2023 TaxID=3062661 RepID=UPI0026E40976|nr:PKD domain-containing protein [Oceanihabitans sp. 2_MG-2023]MDO6596544.1 PKD domain-containing protein [Oceanihabitans sp. 2_MG-2023]